MSKLPDNWTEATIEDCADLNPKHDREIARDTSISFVPMTAVSDGTGEIQDPQTRPFSEVSKGYTHFQTGDVIFAKITPCMENGKIAVARDLTNGLACGSTEFHVLRPRDGISPDYLWRYLRQRTFRTEAERSMTGAVGQRRVPLQYLKVASIPLSPAAEQRRIVAKIDSLSGKSKRVRDNLNHIPRLAEKYKQAILAAVYAAAQRCSGQTVTLGSIAIEVRNGLSKKPSDDPSGLPILRISAVRPLKVHLQDIRYYPVTEAVPTTALLREGDLLFTRYNGNPDFTAVCGMVRGLMRDTAYPDKLIRVRLTNAAEPRFVEIMCASSKSRDWLAPHIKTAAGQHGISGGDLKRLPIPLPSIPNQRAIIGRAETAFVWIDRLASEATSARMLIDRLDQAVLAKAFRGELVPQDAGDEPASVLLERIRAARQAISTPRSRNEEEKASDTAVRPKRIGRRMRS